MLGSCRACCVLFNVLQVGSFESNSAVSSSSGKNTNGSTLQWFVGDQKLEFSSNLGRILELSKSKDGRESVSEFMSTMDAQVILMRTFPPALF